MIYMLLYIDPGTGGMLFTIIFGLMGGLLYSVRSIYMKMKFTAGIGRKEQLSREKVPIVIFSDHKQVQMDHWFRHIRKTFKGDERFMMIQTYYRQNDYKPVYVLRGS